METVKIVTIKSITPLYTRELEEASSIELIHFEETKYKVVSRKGLYNIGDKAVYIMPDFCLPDLPIFDPYTNPEGSKSKLGLIEGKPSRVRAIKFNMSECSDVFKPMYSIGILYPISVVEEYLKEPVTEESLKKLGVYKYIEPDTGIGYQSGVWPENMYKTDETNIELYPNLFDPNKKYYASRKIDGSSITIMVSDKYPQGFISSRTVPRKFKDDDGNLLEDGGMYVTYGYPILEKLLKSGMNNIAIRGELYGTVTKGSGNKNNPDKSKQPSVAIFSVDSIDPISNVATVLPLNEMLDVVTKLTELDGNRVETVSIINVDMEFRTLDSLINYANSIFDFYKETGNMIVEGLVFRSMDSEVSFKVMNPEYDSKK